MNLLGQLSLGMIPSLDITIRKLELKISKVISPDLFLCRNL